MKSDINKKGLAKSFSMGADKYDKWAKTQNNIAQNLVELIPVNKTPLSILDVGCGTGSVVGYTKNRFPDCSILGIDIAEKMIAHCTKTWKEDSSVTFSIMDIESTEPSQTFDRIVSNCCFHWFNNPEKTIRKLLSLLRPGGSLCFSLLTEDSYFEIRDSMNAVLGNSEHLFKLPSLSNYEMILENLNYSKKTAKSVTIAEEFESAFSALKSVNKIGASLKFQKNYKPLSVGEINQLCKYYDTNFRTFSSRVYLSYYVTYFILEK